MQLETTVQFFNLMDAYNHNQFTYSSCEPDVDSPNFLQLQESAERPDDAASADHPPLLGEPLKHLQGAGPPGPAPFAMYGGRRIPLTGVSGAAM